MKLSYLPCAGVYTYIGCYNDGSNGPYSDGQRTFPVMLDQDGMSIDDCAVAARKRGYPIFSLQWFGSCMMGSVADVAKMNAASQNAPDAQCSAIPCPPTEANCTGWTNKVYFLEGMFVSLASLLK
jgi:hypothetical protein